jgi:hypothetical protein
MALGGDEFACEWGGAALHVCVARVRSTHSAHASVAVPAHMCVCPHTRATVYRLWLQSEAARDPEVAAALAALEAPSPRTPRSPHTPVRSGRAPAPWEHHSAASPPARHSNAGPGLREQIARHTALPQHTCGPVPVCASSSSSGSSNTASGSSSRRESPKKSAPARPDFSLPQIKALRQLFPIRQPALRPAAALQSDYQLLDIIGQGEALSHTRCCKLRCVFKQHAGARAHTHTRAHLPEATCVAVVRTRTPAHAQVPLAWPTRRATCPPASWCA